MAPFILVPRLTFGIIFVAFYIFAIFCIRSRNYNDPTSLFFDQERGYQKHYSVVRGEQAQAFLDEASSNVTTPSTEVKAGPGPVMCLGIATVRRAGEQYIRHTVGSLLEGLTDAERSSLHFMFFIAQTDPSTHEIYDEPWTTKLPDTVLKYSEGVDDDTLKQIEEWEQEKDYQSKGLFDYSYLLQACAKTGAPYIAMLEGDILAARGWYPHAVRAAEAVDDLSGGSEYSPSDNKTPEGHPYENPTWLYLRMFYTETYFGWNGEFWLTYLVTSIFVAFALLVVLIFSRAMAPKALGVTLSNPNILAITFVALPACIMLYFAAGRASVLPLSPGPQRMEGFGCCSQAFVFPLQNVPLVVEKIAARGRPYMDMLMEQTAEDEGLERWALAPSLFQHIGSKSSKGDATADANAKKIWNFAFEGLNGDKGVTEVTWRS